MPPTDDQQLSRQIKDANRQVYNRLPVAQYNANTSLFNARREADCRAQLATAASRSGNGRYLDIGTGTGNLLRLAVPLFRQSFAVDIGDRLLARIRPEFPDVHLVAADAERLPFRDESFDCVSCYAVLHHLLHQDRILREAARVLRPGGTLYTDHDPNYFLVRFYRPFYQWRHRRRHGFGSPTDDLAEYHHTRSAGLNPEMLAKQLRDMGFRSVEVGYRITDRPHWPWPMRTMVAALRLAAAVCPAKSFHSHFSLVAVK